MRLVASLRGPDPEIIGVPLTRMYFQMIQATELFSDLTLDIRFGQDIRFLIEISDLNYPKIRSGRNRPNSIRP